MGQDLYEISQDAFSRISQWLSNPTQTIRIYLDKDLIESNFLIPDNLEVLKNWRGDALSKRAFLSSQNFEKNFPPIERENFKGDYVAFSEKTNLEELDIFRKYQKTFSLPLPDLDTLEKRSFLESLKTRKTCREFYQKECSLSLLSTILFTSFGYIHGKEWEEFNDSGFFQEGFRKSYPSATGFHPTIAYIACLNVDGLEKGIYAFNPNTNCLHLVSCEITEEQLKYSLCDQFWVENVSFGIFLVTDLKKVWSKDPQTRGLVANYIEVGHLSQTIQLCASSLELQTFITGIFRDDFLSNLLCFDQSEMLCSFFVGIGYGSNSSIPKDFRPSS